MDVATLLGLRCREMPSTRCEERICSAPRVLRQCLLLQSVRIIIVDEVCSWNQGSKFLTILLILSQFSSMSALSLSLSFFTFILSSVAEYISRLCIVHKATARPQSRCSYAIWILGLDFISGRPVLLGHLYIYICQYVTNYSMNLKSRCTLSFCSLRAVVSSRINMTSSDKASACPEGSSR